MCTYIFYEKYNTRSSCRDVQRNNNNNKINKEYIKRTRNETLT